MKFRDWFIAFISLSIFICGVILLMDEHYIWGLVLGIPSLLLLTVFLSELTNPSRKSYSSNSNYYTSGYNIWLEKRKGYTKHTMVGMYYRNLRSSDMGKFEGYAKAQTNNSHDPYAVSIHNNNGKHLGFLPSGNKSIHDLILRNNGLLPAYGYISCDRSGSNYTGEVAIKTNTSLSTDNPFYDQTVVIVGRFNISQKLLADKLRDLGAYVGNSIHEHTNIVLIGENVKSTQMLDKLKSLIDEGYNIRTIYKDELETILSG